ncbi:Prolyl tripeptidyl peptidase precursor [Planctomycetes bacterium CA13]|uniref:Prolyl tripeptidyl peptidase n=2 Tax=Novipirellula herctigrandis TaxID=2527986 RepID=A0A5C5YZH3_9BACT|nr:Prolyl tripeptidyl peptidase precursor [Planctomycetes bacterium CA13]
MIRIDCFSFFAGLLACFPAIAQEAPDAVQTKPSLSIETIFEGSEFSAQSYSVRWLENDGRPTAFTTLKPSEAYPKFNDIIRHDAATGETQVMVAAAELVPSGESDPLSIDDYAWTADQNLLLIFTNSKRVWRVNSRGDYWLLDRSSRQLRKLGGSEGSESSMMFAKLSPSGKQVTFVRDRNLYVEDLLDDTITPLTFTDSDTIINGTTDWVYEEEFRLRDAFQWSPDGKRIAFWQINTEGVEKFPLVNNTDSLYPRVTWFAYPKAGTRNPICRVGVVSLESKATIWMDLPGDNRDHYVPWIDWMPTESGNDEKTANSSQLLIQQLNRLQNTNKLFIADANSGSTKLLMTETDDAWVDVHDELLWFDSGKQFTWVGERSGWRKICIVDASSGISTWTPPGDLDVIQLLHVDEENKRLYFIASPNNATERYLYGVKFGGDGLKRISPADADGTHSYDIAQDGKFAVHTFSRTGSPPVVDLVSLPTHNSIRVLEENTKARENVAALPSIDTEFFRVTVNDDVQLDAWCMKPASFDPSKTYPLLVYVYGEPAGSTVTNQWGGSTYLWHRMLAERGYVVMSFDNRGAKVPRGREFRKSVYGKIGSIGPKDQADAVRQVLADRPYLDPQRVGIWGWSGGGSSTLHAMFKYPDVYKTGIAVAPVPNQRYYDTIYQERYMGLPQSNVDGYREGSPINFADGLKGDLLIIHGTGDDNCHYQTVEMLIDELVAKNKPFDMMAYPNRSHSIKERKGTKRHLRERMLRFLDEHLK